jgi:hypothetical protein
MWLRESRQLWWRMCCPILDSKCCETLLRGGKCSIVNPSPQLSPLDLGMLHSESEGPSPMESSPAKVDSPLIEQNEGEALDVPKGSCKHVVSFRNDTNCVDNLRAALRLMLSTSDLHGGNSLLPSSIVKCSICAHPSSQTHVCLSCLTFGCWKNGHMRQHFVEKGHHLCMWMNETIYFLCTSVISQY